MKALKLEIQEHPEYGGNGIAILNNGRTYHEPCYSGFLVAHDILEHTTAPHENGYIDELMAFGGIIAGRIANGWSNDYGRCVDFSDIVSDIQILVNASLRENNGFDVPKCGNFLSNQPMMGEIRAAVEAGVIQAVKEFTDGKHTSEHYSIDQPSIVGWIAKGSQLFCKRFPDTYSAVYLFRLIAKECDQWLKTAELGETAMFHISLSDLTARLERSDDY